MELFPAVDEEQLEYIYRIIDDCDYYLLLIGGRYGSTTSEGISFTEKEYEYAIHKGLHIIAIVHGAPEAITAGKSEFNPEKRERLDAFRKRVKTNRVVAEYTSAGELPGIVAVSMYSAMTDHPAVGWIRADRVATEDLLTDINKLRKDNEELAAEVAALKPTREAADASAEFIRRGQRAYLTGGGDVEPTGADKRCFRVEVANYGKTPAFLSHFDVQFAKAAEVEAGPRQVSRRYPFDDRIPADNNTKVLDRIAVPPNTEIIFGAFWYQDTEKREHIFRFILRIAQDGHTRPDVAGVDSSYSHWD